MRPKKETGTRRPAKGRRTSEEAGPSSSTRPPTPDPRLPTVAVVGAGRLGTALALALASRGYEVSAVVARRAGSARRAAACVSTRTLALPASRLAKLPPVKLLLVTTPDDLIAETAARLASRVAPSSSSSVALHASGALSSEALAPLRARGFAVGSMHPLAAVSDPANGAESLRRAFFCVEGDTRAVRAARALVGALGARSFTVDTRDKSLYHAAAVMTSGHAVALFDLASQLLARCGLAPARAREVLLPLLGSTLENLSAQTPARALTGTFARADVATVRKHLASLRALTTTEEDAAPERDVSALDVYALLGRHSLRLAREAGADRAALEEIARALAESPDGR